jgi:DNA ligase (NAD+)
MGNFDTAFTGSQSEVVGLLRRLDRAYYVAGEPLVSNDEYNKIKEIARGRFPSDPYFSEVGAAEGGDKVSLPYVLGSLEKYKPSSVERWLTRFSTMAPLLVMEKLDGVSVYVELVDGRVALAATRGDGREGRNITHKVSRILPRVGRLTASLRGEVVMTGDSHVSLGMANRRNAVTGILGRDDLTGVEHLTVIFYEMIDGHFGPQSSALKALEAAGLRVPRHSIMRFGKAVPERLTEILTGFKAEDEYDIDGLVLVPDQYVREDVERPKDKVSYKVNEDSTPATVREVTWNITRSGRLVPLVWLEEPVKLSGAMVSKATGHNFEFVEKEGIAPGAKIGVVRSGDVIPYIVEVFEPGAAPESLDSCPYCDGPVRRDGVDMKCAGGSCSDYHRVYHFLRNMGVEEVALATLERLGINTVQRAYTITEHEIAREEGFGKKRAGTIVSEIKRSLESTPERLIAALGIPGVGTKTASALVAHFPQIADNFTHFFEVTEGDIVMIPGIGEKVARNVVKNRDRYLSLYHFLMTLGLNFYGAAAPAGDGSLAGVQFALTGSGPVRREKLEAQIRNRGGEVGGMKKTTDYLVTGDPTSNSGKSKKAREFGTKVISYEELIEMLR